MKLKENSFNAFFDLYNNTIMLIVSHQILATVPLKIIHAIRSVCVVLFYNIKPHWLF